MLCGNNGGQSVTDQSIMASIFDLSNWGVSPNLSKLMMSGYFGTYFYFIELKSDENTTTGENFKK